MNFVPYTCLLISGIDLKNLISHTPRERETKVLRPSPYVIKRAKEWKLTTYLSPPTRPLTHNGFLFHQPLFKKLC